MASFKGQGLILLQANDSGVSYTFDFPICTSATASDGSIAYGLTISSVSTSSTNSAGTTITSLIDSSSLSGTEVVVTLSYPSEGIDRYKITFVLTLSDSSTKEFDFSKVYVKEI